MPEDRRLGERDLRRATGQGGAAKRLAQHHCRRHDHCDRIGDVLARNVRRRAARWLKQAFVVGTQFRLNSTCPNAGASPGSRL